MDTIDVVKRKYAAVEGALTERARRLWAGAEADALGRGGVRLVARATGLAISTVWTGRQEVRAPSSHAVVRDRRAGAGRPRVETKYPGLITSLEQLVSASVRGDPESPLRWTLKSLRQLAAELTAAGMKVSAQKVGELLHAQGFSLQGTSRVKEGTQHPERDVQFAHINDRTKELLAQQQPVISVDTKKKEAVGDYARPGREWHKKGKPVEVNTYDFLQRGDSMAIPYGVYDIANNSGFINVGVDHDTPRFAVASIAKWWSSIGRERYPRAKRILITADSGGSNSAVSRVWKAQLQEFADNSGLIVEVSHFPAGTSKWNKIEHRLFSFVSLNWRCQPLISYQTVISLIEGTKTSKGLTVRASLDDQRYPVGGTVSKLAFAALSLERNLALARWNYSLRPRSADEVRQRMTPPPKPPSADERWRPIIAKQIASGLNCAKFCAKHRINYDAFITARKRIKGVMSPAKSRGRKLYLIKIQYERGASRK